MGGSCSYVALYYKAGEISRDFILCDNIKNGNQTGFLSKLEAFFAVCFKGGMSLLNGEEPAFCGIYTKKAMERPLFCMLKY